LDTLFVKLIEKGFDYLDTEKTKIGSGMVKSVVGIKRCHDYGWREV